MEPESAASLERSYGLVEASWARARQEASLKRREGGTPEFRPLSPPPHPTRPQNHYPVQPHVESARTCRAENQNQATVTFFLGTSSKRKLDRGCCTLVAFICSSLSR